MPSLPDQDDLDAGAALYATFFPDEEFGALPVYGNPDIAESHEGYRARDYGTLEEAILSADDGGILWMSEFYWDGDSWHIVVTYLDVA